MTETEGVRNWYCVRTQPKHEHIAAARLRTIPEVEVFSPQMRFKRATRRGARWCSEAMFPGYLFARFDFDTRLRQVNAANGVTGIVRFGKEYAMVSDTIIDHLRTHIGTDQVAIIDSEAKLGAEVHVVDGPFAGVTAVVTQVLPGRERIRILLELLGQQIEAEVHRDAVLGAKQHPLAD